MDCPLCLRPVPQALMERHHLLTKRVDRKRTEEVCRECHKTLHGLFSNRELRDTELGTLEGLLANEKFQAALVFIRKMPPGAFMRMKEAQGRRKHKR